MATKRRMTADLDGVIIPSQCRCGFDVTSEPEHMQDGHMLAHWRKEGVVAVDRDKGGFVIKSDHPHLVGEDYLDPRKVKIVDNFGPRELPRRKMPRLPNVPALSMPLLPPKWAVLTVLGQVATLSSTTWPGLLSEPLHDWAAMLNEAWQYPMVSVPIIVSLVLSFLMRDVRDRIATLVAWILVLTTIAVGLLLVLAFWRWVQP